MESRFLRCVLRPVVVDSSPRFAKDWLEIAPRGDELEGNFFWVYGNEMEDILWKDTKDVEYEKD